MLEAAAAAGIAGLITSAAAGIALIVKAVSTSMCTTIRTPCCSCSREMPDVVQADEVKPIKPVEEVLHLEN